MKNTRCNSISGATNINQKQNFDAEKQAQHNAADKPNCLIVLSPVSGGRIN